MKTSQNTSSDNNLNTEFSRKIEKLLKLKKWEFEKQIEDKWERKAILDVLDANQDNEELAIFFIENKDWRFIEWIPTAKRTKAMIKAALKKNIWALGSVTEEMKSDTRVAESIITAKIKSGESFLEIEKYIQQYFSDEKQQQKLIKYYLKMQKVSWALARDDLTQYLVAIENTKFYKYLKDEKLIKSVGKYIKPDNNCIKKFTKAIDDANIDELSEEEKQEKYFEVFSRVIWKNLDELSDDEKIVFEKILEICIQEYNKKFNPQKTPGSKDKNWENDPGVGENHYDIDDDFEDYTPEEKLDYCYPTRSYTISDNWNYSVKLESNRSLEISKSEMKKASVAALENYAKFYETLCEMKLDFLWKKFRKKFTHACSESFGFDEFNGEWITSNKLLSVVNFVSRNIWIPEEEYENSEGDKEVWCFKEISSAKIVFRDIKDTGKINGEEIDSSPWSSRRWVVEKYMLEKWLIDDTWWFNISSWK